MSAFAIRQSTARAQTATVDLGRAAPFGVLAGTTVTNTGPTVVNGDLGVSPGTAVTGFPPGVVNGTIHAGDATAAGAQVDLTAAYTDAATRTPTGPLPAAIGGLTFTPGVYNAPAAVGLTGTVTLDAQGDPNAVFIFQIGSALTTASGSVVNLINGANPCNVFWQIGSSATLGTGSAFAGNILALTSITVTTGVTLNGRALARNGAVTLDTDLINTPDCVSPTPTPTPTATVTRRVNRANNNGNQQAVAHQDNGQDLNLNQHDDHDSSSVIRSYDRHANVPFIR
jgi:Ice-binding-like